MRVSLRSSPAALHWLLPVATVIAMTMLLAEAGRSASGDGPHLMGTELRLAELVRDLELGRAFRLFSTLIAPQPPAGYIPGILSFFVLGAGSAAGIAAMGIPMLLCWDALRRLADGRLPWAAWLALCASPLTWLYVEQHGRDLVAGAALAQALSWLYATRSFTERRACVWFGVWLGLGFLTKYTFPMFAALPCLAAGVALRSRDRWKNLGFAIAAFAVVTLPWFLSYSDRILHYVIPSDEAMTASQALNRRAPGEAQQLEKATLYPLALKDALGWPGAVTVLIAAAFGPRMTVFPLLAAIGGVAALSPLAQAQDRYALPAFVVLTALVLPLARRWWGALVVLGVFVPQLVVTVGAFRPGAPATENALFDHPPATARVLSWPGSRSYGPTDFDVRRWRIDEAIRAMRTLHGRPAGTVGLLLPRAANVPDFGTFLARSAALGNHWDFANVNLGANHGGLPDEFFMGPMRDGAWPPADFTALYAILTEPPDPDATQWLRKQRLTEESRFSLPNGATGVLYRVARP